MNDSWRDDAQRKMSLHLHMLYGARAERAVMASSSVEDAAWLRTVDRARLAVEQEERITALVVQTRRTCAALWSAGEEALLLGIMRAFADSTIFWNPVGRSLAEGFCLFAQEKLTASGRGDLAALARLLGVSSGLPSAPGRASPWPDQRPPPDLGIPKIIASEGFVSRWSLLDDAGQPKLGAVLAAPHDYFILCFEDRSMLLGSKRVAHD